MPFVNGEELTRLQTADELLKSVSPFLADAEAISREYGSLANQTSYDPNATSGGIFAEAVERVRRERRKRVVSKIAGQIATEQGAAIDAEIIAAEGEAITAAEAARYAAEEEPRERELAETRVKRRITEKTRQHLRTIRPDELEAEYEEAHGAEITAAEERRFKQEEEEEFRRAAAARAERTITAATRKEIRDRIEAEEALKASAAAETAERLKMRIDRMKEVGGRQSQIPLVHFEKGDVIVIELCPENTSYSGDTNATVSRTLRPSIVDPDEGVVRMMDDSWRAGSIEPALQGLSFKSGTLLALQAPEELAKATADREPPVLMRSVALPLNHDGQDHTSDRYEIHRIKMQTGDGEQLLLGPADYNRYR